ncbi:MAG: hypothetical protein FJ026_00045 [Chloroflexi bacterium]|nr:hypothetical protein [Chloroflexota bacterium]
MSTAWPSKKSTRYRAFDSPLILLGLFVALSVILTHPLMADLGSRILGAPAPGDNFEYLYKVWWFKHALFDLQVTPFFNPGMFYPFGYNVSLSETTLSNIVPALPLTLLFGEVVAYNLTMWGSFLLSGLGMYLLVLHFTRNRIAGFFSGLVFAFCPYRLAHLGAGHLPLMGTQWLPLFVLFLDRVIVRPRPRDAFLAGLFYSLGALSAWYYAYMFALVGIVYTLLRGRPWRERLRQKPFVRSLVVFAMVCLVLIAPIVLPVTRLWREGDRPQSLRYVDQFSASPLDLVYPNVLHPLWGAALLQRYAQNPENILYLGAVPLLLAIIGLWRQDRTRQTLAWVGLVFAVLACGTTLHGMHGPVYIRVPATVERLFTIGMSLLSNRLALYPISSYSLRVPEAVYLPLPTLLLSLYLPFFNAMRVWARFGLVTLFAVAVLSGYGVRYLLRRRRWGQMAMAALFALLLLEFAAFPHASGTSGVQARPVDDWLASQEGEFAIMEFPVIKAMTGHSLYAMRTHGKAVAFGYGTFFPRAFNEQRSLLESFPGSESIAQLKRWSVRYVLVGSRTYGAEWPQRQRDLSTAAGLRYVLTLDDEPVYEGDRLLRFLPGTERAFIVDQIHVYEVW